MSAHNTTVLYGASPYPADFEPVLPIPRPEPPFPAYQQWALASDVKVGEHND